MLSLVWNWRRSRRLRRFFRPALVLLLFTCLSLFFANVVLTRVMSADAILDGLHREVVARNSTTGLGKEDVCADYFRLLYNKNSDWSVRSFGDEKTSFFSRRNIIRSIRHLRVYGHCFIRNSAPVGELNIEEIDNRLFPVFTLQLPVFTRWDGVTFEGLPVMDDLHGSKSVDIGDGTHLSFWRRLKDSSNGKGIVISLADGGVDEIKRLLKILRILNNTLPLQIVHKGDLSDASVQDIIHSARGDIEVKFGNKLHKLESQQEIWFVNTERSIKDDSWDLFKRFSNKWLASLFTSFDEMILVDSDAAFFVNPEVLFDSVEYRETGAYFFKDRPIDEYVKSSDLRFLKKLLPLEKEYSTFNIPHLTQVTSENGFMKLGYKHFMESGVVVMKRSNHFPGLLISTAMQLWKETSEPIYGDKELFWLGQSISGCEEYRFNKYPAGSLGTIKHDEKSNVNYVCSAQLAHFDKDLKLLWTNGGLRNCKKTSWESDYADYKDLREKFQSDGELRDHYEAPIEVNGAIIPPHTRLSWLQKLRRAKIGFQRRVEMGCSGYIWCAYDNSKYDKGDTIKFTNEEINSVNSIVNLWNGLSFP